MDYTPSRKIKNSGTKKNIGYFPSKKNNRAICFESLLERDYLHLIEFDSDVIEYYEQPITVEYLISDKKYHYTPDFKVVRKNKIQLVEVKPYIKLQKMLSDDRKKQKFITAYYYCINKGWEFKIITDNDLRFGNLLKNIKHLFMYSTINIKATDKLKIKNYIVLNEKASISFILSNLATQEEKAKYRAYILNLIYNHTLATDMSVPITDESILTIS